MPTSQGGSFRRKNGRLEQVSEPPKEQRYGAHAVHPSKVETSKSKAEAPATAPTASPSGAKSSAPVKGKDDVSTTS